MRLSGVIFEVGFESDLESSLKAPRLEIDERDISMQNLKCQSDSSTIRFTVNKIYIQVRRAVHRFTKPRDGSGFSMLEAVVVVGVLLALAVGGFFAYGPIVKNAKLAKVKSAVSEVFTAVQVAQIDGDPTTSVISVIESYNSSQDTIKFEIRRGENQPTIAAMSTAGAISTEGYVPQSDSDFCLKATAVGDTSIFAEMGDCQAPAPVPTPTQIPTPTATSITTPTPTAEATPTAIPTLTPTPAPTGSSDPTLTKTILTYKCDAGTSGNFPFHDISQGTLTIDGSDGSKIENTYANAQWAASTLLKAGITYTVTFDGKYNWLYQGNSRIAGCILSLDHWGEQSGVTKAQYGLHGAPKLASVPDRIPSTVTDLSDFFEGATVFNDPNVSKWDVSNVTKFTRMFYQAQAFNQPLNDWNIAKAENIAIMFGFASAFNQPLDMWNTSNVTDMSGAFNYAKAFNQNINSWDVSKTTRMNDMFYRASQFNQPLDKWNVANVTTMANMFRNTTVFNQDIGSWRPAKVTNMDYMFASNAVFRHNLSAWTFNVKPSYTAWAPTGLPTTSYPKFVN